LAIQETANPVVVLFPEWQIKPTLVARFCNLLLAQAGIIGQVAHKVTGHDDLGKEEQERQKEEKDHQP
jgi:hypothetical protein